MPFEPMPASVSPRCRAWSVRRGEVGIDGDELLHVGDFGRQDDPVARPARCVPPRGPSSIADCTMASRITSSADKGEPLAALSSISDVSRA